MTLNSTDAIHLFKEKQAAEYLNFTQRALQNWRVRGGGPNFVKVSARAIRYRRCDLDQWMIERLRANTSQRRI